MRVRLLGPLSIETDGGEVQVGPAKQRALLCVLALSPQRAVHADRLIESLWGEEPPATAAKTLQTYVSALRKVLPAGSLGSEAGGYVLRVERSDVDAHQFEEAARRARTLEGSGQVAEAAAAAAEALSLWRGEVLVELADASAASAEVSRLAELRRAVQEHLADLRLELGDHASAVPDLEAGVAAEPLRERRWAQLITALYRCGRQADALRAYQRLRELLGEELGIEPSAELAALERAVLRQSTELDWVGTGSPATPTDPTAPVGTLTFLFASLEDPTPVDQVDEASRAAAGAREVVRDAVASAGGTVFQEDGGTIRAVFTSASCALDAAVRAWRGAHLAPDADRACASLRLALHSGLAEGRDGGYSGTAVSRAARLEAAAHGGQAVLSGATYELLEGSRPEGVTLRDLGEHRLVDLDRPMRVYEVEVEELTSPSRPLRSLEGLQRANNLPVPASGFVGRVVELATLRELTSTSRVVTLTGLGGSGKTRLALQLATELFDATGDDTCFVDLAPLSSPEQVPAATAAALGVRVTSGALTESLIDVLRGRRLVLLLDNCEHVIDASAKLADRVVRNCPKVLLLSTSRERLGIDGETVYRVPALALPPVEGTALAEIDQFDSVKLFLAAARRHEPSFALDDESARLVVELCHRLDGVPLALELAAARASSMSLTDLVGHLDRRFELLTRGARTASPRQQTLRAAITWSYDMLSPSEQRMLQCLTVFPGSFDTEGALAVGAQLELESLASSDLLASLVAKSLVDTDRSPAGLRYRCLETVRQFAAEAGAGDGALAGARRAHADYFLGLAETAAPGLRGSDQMRWLRRLQVEWDSIRAAFAYFGDDGYGAEAVLRMGVALWSPLAYWRPSTDTEISLVLDTLSRSGGVPRELRATAAAHMARVVTDEDTKLGLSLAHEALEIAEGLQREDLAAHAWPTLGRLAAARGEEDEALEFAARLRTFARHRGDMTALRDAVFVETLTRQDDADGRASSWRQLVALSQQIGAPISIVGWRLRLADGEFERGDHAAALAVLDEDLPLVAELGITYLVVPGVLLRARVLMAMDDTARAVEDFRSVLLNARRHGILRDDLADAVRGVARCVSRAGRWRWAATLHAAADGIAGAAGERCAGADQAPSDEDVASLRDLLGAEQYEEARAEGARLSRDDALELALEYTRAGRGSS